MKTTSYIFAIFIMAILALSFTGCGGHNSEAWKSMDVAESIIEERPDSSYQILQSIDASSLKVDEEKARYALLMSMALDKNYIDTTDFKVLQPAIDYYLKKGTPDEKLKTYYYQGIIYLNKGDDDNAMSSFFKAKEYMTNVQDTLAITRLLTAQGILYAKQYKYKEYIANSLACADLLKSKQLPLYEMLNYAKALNGSVILHDKVKADSILKLITPLIDKVDDGNEFILPLQLLYTINFGDTNEIKSALNRHSYRDFSNELNLDIAYGYSLVGEGEKASIFFEKVDTTDQTISPLKYLSIKSNVLESNQLYSDALRAQKSYCANLEAFHRSLFSQDLLFADKRHEIELNNMSQIQKKDRAIGLWAGGVLALLLICGLVYYRYRLGRAKQELSEKEVLRLSLERSALTKEKERLELENRNKELELGRQALEAENLQKEKLAIELERNNSELNLKKTELEAENLRLQIAQLEDERDDLKELLQKSELTDSVKEVIRERLNMLNSLMAKEITNNKNHSRQYDDWVMSMRSDAEKFMSSTRLALQASYPNMIEYLKSHGLTEHEMNYVCLYAIGLRGKEVGEFTKIKGHYNLSSEIRKKLGLEESDTNLGNFVRGLMNQP